MMRGDQGETNVVPLERSGAQISATVEPRVLDDAELAAAQTRIDAGACHAIFDALSYTIRLKTEELTLFHGLSVGFPKGRHVVILGHKGSGKTILVDLLLQQRPPTRGQVVVNSRLSTPIHNASSVWDKRLSVRQNAIFLARILNLDPKAFLRAAGDFCALKPQQLREPMSNLPSQARRRLGTLVMLSAGYDCLLIDSPLRPRTFGFEDDFGRALKDKVLSHDYIMCAHSPKIIPENCDLVYILYHGRLYMFEDVARAVTVFNALPVPKPSLTDAPDNDAGEGGDDEDQLGMGV